MTTIQTWTLTGLAVVALAIGALLATGALTSAQTSTPVGATPTPSAGGTFKSNEDPTHEAGESAEHEVQEDSGQFKPGHRDGHGHGSNEDPTHESSESSEREAQEDAGNTTANSTTPPGA
jgi:hypothetical protein